MPTWFHHDRLGSTRALTDNTGAVVGSFTYDPYGSTTASTGTATTPIGYAGAYKDSESGFLYLINRYYSPGTGQFLTRDPLVGLTLAPYSYAANNPVNLADPSGLMVVEDGGGASSPPPPSMTPFSPCSGYEAVSPGQSGGFSVSWGGIAADAATGYAQGLGYRTSALGSALREGSSYAGSTLRAASQSARMWEPLVDAAPVLGGAISFGTDIASGQNLGRSAANAIGATAGGYVGTAVGGAACGALAAATEGVGSLTCGVLTSVGAVAGGVVGGYVGNGVSDVVNSISSWF